MENATFEDDPALPAPPYPTGTFEIDEVREKILEYIWHIAHCEPPSVAGQALTLATSRLIELIEADWEATARKAAELDAEEQAEREKAA